MFVSSSSEATLGGSERKQNTCRKIHSLRIKMLASYTVGLAADSWLAYMDRLLTPGVESEEVWPKIEKLINIYYDALDAPKTGKKVGGVEAVTLSDEEARARRTQKTIMERKAPPTFPFLIEMRERDYWVTHRTEKSVDTLLHGRKPFVEIRRRDEKFNVVIDRWTPYDGDGI